MFGLAMALVIGGCTAERVEGPGGGAEQRERPEAYLVLEEGGSDGVIAAVLHVSAPGSRPVAGIQGWVAWDPDELELIGQIATDHVLMLNASGASAGRLRFLAVDARGLPRQPFELRFRRSKGRPSGMTLGVEELVTTAFNVYPGATIRPLLRTMHTPGAATARVLSVDDWYAKLEAERPTPRVRSIAGDGAVYGDATLSGSVTVADVVSVSNVAVGNISLLTAVSRDYAIAANVAPTNLPGLGEAADPVPPGRNSDGTFTLSVADVTLISSEAVGTDQPVVGEPIPGRAALTNRVIVADSILANRTFFRDSIYEIRGTVIVGNADAADVTLTIQPGTVIEGDQATRGTLVIRRGANILALGTRLEPIVFTCTAPANMPGCWGGLVINGFSVLNNGSTNGDGTVGFPTKQGPGNTGRYGGNLVEDSSGALRYVRVEYAGAHPQGTAEALAGLRLLGVGSRTRIDTLQVRESLGDGIYVGGGTARLRNVVFANNRRDGLGWEDGWQGAGQFLIVQLGPQSQHGLHGTNWLVNPNAGPRSAPIISNVTVVGPPAGALGSAIALGDGSVARIFNAIIERAAITGFDVSGTASCSVGGDSLDLRSSIFFNSPGVDFSTDTDCFDEGAFALEPARGNRSIAPGLLAPLVNAAPDFRIATGSAALSGYQQPPSPVGEPFFDLTAVYLGAVGPANFLGSNVPWYAGWTRGW